MTLQVFVLMGLRSFEVDGEYPARTASAQYNGLENIKGKWSCPIAGSVHAGSGSGWSGINGCHYRVGD